jgi:hypothetical protein
VAAQVTEQIISKKLTSIRGRIYTLPLKSFCMIAMFGFSAGEVAAVNI